MTPISPVCYSSIMPQPLQKLRMGARQLVLLSACAAASFAIIFRSEMNLLEAFETHWTYYWMASLWLLWAFALLRLRGPLGQWLRAGFEASRSQKLGLAAALGLLLIYVLTHADARVRMLSDEYNHLSVAQAMHHLH